MNRKAKVDLFEQLRQKHEFGVGTVTCVAAKSGWIAAWFGSQLVALPPPHHYPQRARPKLDGVTALADRVLKADRDAPREHRHTALPA
jgi:hypothetical protein